MADVRTFRAATMRDALDLVRDELGADAVILHTRQVARRRLLPWSKPIEEVEITATLTLNVGTAPERKPTKRTTPAVSPKAEPTSERPAPRSAIGGSATVNRPAGGRLDLVSEPEETIAEVLGRIQVIDRLEAHDRRGIVSERPRNAPTSAAHLFPETGRACESSQRASQRHGVRRWGRVRSDRRADSPARRDPADAARPGTRHGRSAE